MKKRIVALLTSIALVLCLIPTVMAEASATNLGSTPVQLDICDGSISIVSGTDTVTYTQGSNVYTSTGGCIVTQSNPALPTSNRIDITADSEDFLEVKLTIAGLNIEAEESPIALLNYAVVTLTLVSENVLTCTGTSANSGNQAGLRVPEDADLTVKGNGSLIATGSERCAGIGGGYYGNGGTITISGGAVTATGGYYGAGIGGGSYGTGGTITITAGAVTATGGSGSPGDYGGGAGIGGGKHGNGGTITISGGTVTATGGKYGGAGIGGGDGGNGGTITITGGEVATSGGYGGAGIGGGNLGNGGTVTVSGGTVTATGGSGQFGEYGGAGIGGGQQGDGGTITITGGNVTATGGGDLYGYYGGGAGIGGGSYGTGGRVSISDAAVTAKGYCCAIGGGEFDNAWGCASIDIGDNMTLNLSYIRSNGSLYQERIDITKLPASAAAALSGNCPIFEAEAKGHSGVTYQWQVKDGSTWTDVEGQTSAIASIPMSEANDGATYRCEITNVYGNTVYTDEAQAYILAFTKQPESVETNLDEIAALTVTSSCSNVTYQWQRSYDGMSWADVAGKTSPTLVVNTTLSENGAWYRCVITATNGDQLASEPARITVNTNAVTYSTDYYLEQADGSYAVVERTTVESQKGASVTAPEKEFDHYTENTSKGKHSGTVAEDSSLVLSRYYDRCEYTLTFETDGGGAIAPITAKHGTAIELPANVSRYGYDFGGWYLDEELTEKAELTVMPTENTTVYAKWTAVGADRGTEYHINGITLLGADYQKIDSVPKGSFYAQVSVTNLCSEQMDTLILATYDESGRMLDLYFLFADPQIGQTFSLGALIDNSDGEVAELRAYIIPLLGGPMIPLANSVSTNG